MEKILLIEIENILFLNRKQIQLFFCALITFL